MNFVRPELIAWIRRWREPLVWSGICVFGLLLIVSGDGLARILLGGAISGVSAAFIPGSIRRLRLSEPELSTGAVQIDEGRIAYFGPMGGAFVDIASLERLEIVSRHWRLTSGDGSQIYIPRGAAGAERLPDAFSVLNGFDLSAAFPKSGDGRVTTTILWQRERPSALATRPHLD